MSTFAELIALTRSLVDFPSPATGGTDPISDTNLLRWLNDGFDEMADAIYGIPADVEFTIGAGAGTARTVAVTKPASGVTISENDQDYVYYKVSSARSYGPFENLTSGVSDTSLRIMLKLSPDDPRFVSVMNATGTYLNYYWIDGDRGFLLLPHTLSAQNTIHIRYRKLLTRADETTDSVDSYFSEQDEMYPVYKACKILCVQLDDSRAGTFHELAGYKDERTGKYTGELGKFTSRKHTIDLAPAAQIMGGGVRRVPGRIR